MSSQTANIDELNNPDILRVVWDTFAELAKQPGALDFRSHFTLVGADEGSVYNRAFTKCSEAGLFPPHVRQSDYPPFKHIVLKVYHSAIGMGLLLPSRLDQALNWNEHVGIFHFTADGVRYFSEGFISIDDPGQLATVLFDLKQRLPAIQDGQIELLLEAQRCVRSGCSRAAMVVMGVASEDACIGLMDAIPLNCQSPTRGSSLLADWKSCSNTSLAFSARWKPAVRLLEAIKKAVRTPGRGELWWQWWELVPGSLFTVGEAVRVGRNAAAHDTQRKFPKAEVALLLSAMPTQLEMIANLTDFLKSPPSNLKPIKI